MTSVSLNEPAADRRRTSVLDATLGLTGSVCELLVVAMVVVVTLDVALRNLVGASLMITDELSGYLLVAVTFLGVGLSLRAEALFRVELVVGRLSGRVRAAVEIVFDALALAFTVILDIHLVQHVINSYERMMLSNSAWAVPLYIPQVLMPAGTTLLAVLLALGIGRRLAGLARRDHRT